VGVAGRQDVLTINVSASSCTQQVYDSLTTAITIPATTNTKIKACV
jgi:hypothetical protein